MNKKLKKLILFPLFAAFILSLFSCENVLGNNSETEIKKENETPALEEEKAYIVFSLVEQKPKVTSINNGRTVSSVIVSSLFSDITFKGTRDDGLTIQLNANSFSELSGKKIEIQTGNWTFTLEAFMGKTSTNAGEKYVAKLVNQQINPGPNPISMKLTADQTAIDQPENHPGSWELTLEFPGKPINLVIISLYKYESYITATDLSTLVPAFQISKTKGVDYTGNNNQTLKIGEAERATGNYIIQVDFCVTSENPDGSIQKEVINSWQEFMRINPGALSSGSITLPQTNQVYKIEYVNAHWDTSYSGDIIVNYTKDSGELTGGVRYINLPPVTAMNWPGYEFQGWFLDSEFKTAAPASFPVSDLEDKKFYAKWRELVFNIYIDCNGDDDNDGTKDHPMQTIQAAYAKFDSPSAVDANGKPLSTIHILSDYVKENTSGLKAFDAGQGTTAPVKINIVGEKGKVKGAPVTITANLPNSQSFLYLINGQRFDISNVNIISDKKLSDEFDYNGHGCLYIENGAELTLTDSSITKYYAKGCIVAVEGECWLDNVTISNNVAVSDPDESTEWGCAVHVPTGTLHIKNKILIQNNQTFNNENTNLNKPYNLWIGKYIAPEHILHEIEIEGPITGSNIGIKLDPETRTFTKNYNSNEGSKEPENYFFSDSGFDIVKDSSGEAAVKCVVYINGNVADTDGDGSKTNPFGSLTQAVNKITSLNDESLDVTFYVSGTVKSNTVIEGSGSTNELKANSLCIEGRGSDSNWKTAAGKTVLTGDMDGDGEGDDAVITMAANIPLELRNLTITKGKSSSSGGALSYDIGKNVNIQNCIFTENEAQDCGGVIYYSGTSSNGRITITNCEFNNNIVRKTGSAYGQGGAIYFKEAELILEDVHLINNVASERGGAIYAGSNGNLKIKNSVIEKNAAGNQGGGIYISSSVFGEIEDEDSIIRQNVITQKNIATHTSENERSGGAVYVAAGGSFTMTDGEISGNASYSGGAVFVRGTFNLNGGTIKSNKRIVTNSDTNFANSAASTIYSNISSKVSGSDQSSNIEVGVPGTFNMNQGTITSTLTRGQNGAAVCVYASKNGSDPNGGTATFNMTGGEITGLTSDESAVIYLEGDPNNGESYNIIFNMSGGKISENKTVKNTGTNWNSYGFGGAIYLGQYSKFIMSGGEISDNKTYKKNAGGGIYIVKKISPEAAIPKLIFGTSAKESTIKISGNKSDTANTEKNDNIYFPDGSTTFIDIKGSLSSSSEIGINKAFTILPFSAGFVTNCSSIVPSDVFVSDLGLTITNQSGVEVSYSSGTVNISPGLPENYVCKWTQTLSGTKRTITITIKDLKGNTVTPEASSIHVDYYKGSDVIVSESSLSFELPDWWTEVPEGSPFHVKFNIKADDSVTYSYDYWPTEGE